MNDKESGKHDAARGTNKAPATSPKEMAIYNLPAKEFKRIILKKLSALQEIIDYGMKSASFARMQSSVNWLGLMHL